MKNLNPNTKNEIDHSIDVRYEKDVFEAFDKFIKKWCGDYYPHLIDSDENDGQFIRDKIASKLQEVARKDFVAGDWKDVHAHYINGQFFIGDKPLKRCMECFAQLKGEQHE